MIKKFLKFSGLQLFALEGLSTPLVQGYATLHIVGWE